MWGIDRLSAGELGNTRRRLRTSKVALLSQSAAVDRRGQPVLDSLENLGIHPIRIFAPEHGFDGSAQAEQSVDAPQISAQDNSARFEGEPEAESDNISDIYSLQDAETGQTETPQPPPPAEWVSLYGDSKDSLSPRSDHWEGVDLLVIDLVDIGSRYYTYVWSALLAARSAEKAGVHTLVLDRPNPISGDPNLIEGAPQQDGFTSFVGLEPLPIRHSMTMAELLVHFFEKDGKPLGSDGAISVVSTRGWERHRTASNWSRPFIAPSPNMPTVETALVYPGGCLLEGTNLSEGRGTTTPFQSVGAPFLDSVALARSLSDARLPGLMVRPHSFRPTFEKHAGQLCHGVSLHVTQSSLFRPVTTYLTLIALARAQSPEAFGFRSETYEFEDKIPAFDLLTGDSAAREALENGASPEELVALVAPVDADWKAVVAQAEQLALAARA